MADSNAHHHLNEKSILHLHKQFASECARPRRHMIAFIIKLRPNKYTWAWIDISSLCIFLFLFLANRDLLYSARIRHNLHTNGNWKNTARNENSFIIRFWGVVLGVLLVQNIRHRKTLSKLLLFTTFTASHRET